MEVGSFIFKLVQLDHVYTTMANVVGDVGSTDFVTFHVLRLVTSMEVGTLVAKLVIVAINVEDKVVTIMVIVVSIKRIYVRLETVRTFGVNVNVDVPLHEVDS